MRGVRQLVQEPEGSVSGVLEPHAICGQWCKGRDQRMQAPVSEPEMELLDCQ